MGEIKSTLDLVMEKTRHLTLSQEEKRMQNRIEVRRRLQGLLQKYKDSILKKENLIKEIDDLKIFFDSNVDKILADLLINSFKLGRDNTLFLELFGGIYGLNLSGLEMIFQNFKSAEKSAIEERVKQKKRDLSKKRFISGSAVVPNLENDSEWLSILNHIKENFDEVLSKKKAALNKELSLD